MKKNQKQNSSDDELRFENEFRKLKIAAESGARFYLGNHEGADEIPVEVEKQFLDNIEAFEKALQNSKEITLFEFLGRPNFRNEGDLTDDELNDELKKLEELMFQHNTTCDVIYKVDNRVFYKFITEELFHKTTANINIPGFMKHFIYEEFHPNHEEDIRYMCIELMNRLTNKKIDSNYLYVSNQCEENLKELLKFQDTIARFGKADFDEVSLNISGHLATMLFRVAFDGFVSEGTAPIHFEGEGLFKLEYSVDGEYWEFTSFMLPGMRSTIS